MAAPKRMELVLGDIDIKAHIAQFPAGAKSCMSEPMKMWKDQSSSLRMTTLTGSLTEEQKWLRKPWTLETQEYDTATHADRNIVSIGHPNGLADRAQYVLLRRVSETRFVVIRVTEWYAFKRHQRIERQTASQVEALLKIEGTSSDMTKRYQNPRARRRAVDNDPGISKADGVAFSGLDFDETTGRSTFQYASDAEGEAPGAKAKDEDGGPEADPDDGMRSDDQSDLDYAAKIDLFEEHDAELAAEFEEELLEANLLGDAPRAVDDEDSESGGGGGGGDGSDGGKDAAGKDGEDVKPKIRRGAGARGKSSSSDPEPMDVDAEVVPRDAGIEEIKLIGKNMFGGGGGGGKAGKRKRGHSSSDSSSSASDSDYGLGPKAKAKALAKAAAKAAKTTVDKKPVIPGVNAPAVAAAVPALHRSASSASAAGATSASAAGAAKGPPLKKIKTEDGAVPVSHTPAVSAPSSAPMSAAMSAGAGAEPTGDPLITEADIIAVFRVSTGTPIKSAATLFSSRFNMNLPANRDILRKVAGKVLLLAKGVVNITLRPEFA